VRNHRFRGELLDHVASAARRIILRPEHYPTLGGCLSTPAALTVRRWTTTWRRTAPQTSTDCLNRVPAAGGATIVWLLVAIVALLMARASTRRRHRVAENLGWAEAARPPWYRRWWVVGVALLIVGFIATGALSGGGSHKSEAATGATVTRGALPSASSAAVIAGSYRSDGALPDPRCTPGTTNPLVTAETISSTICKKGWTGKIRPSLSVTAPLKRSAMTAYGARGSPAGYEYDHLIPLELGGAVDDPANMWPESNKGMWNSTVKNGIENRLNQLVCKGSMSLGAAQQAVASDWIAAYQRYVSTKPKGAEAPPGD
jgi:hypothetical protein